MENLRITINFSEYAYKIIDEDMSNFNNKAKPLSSFINKIFKNFVYDSQFTLSNSIYNYKLKLIDDTSELENSDLLEKILLHRRNTILKKAQKYTLGVSKKIKFNNYNSKIIDKSEDVEYFHHKAPLYVKYIIEDYCEKEYYIREQIYFKEILDEVNNSIDSKKIIKVTYINRNNEIKKTLKPYKIFINENNTHSYLAAYYIEEKRLL